MGRLIDADVLLEYWHISEKCEECHWNNHDCSKPPYYSLHDICEGIDEVPTIDAIPVEWLELHAREYYEDWGEEPITVENALKMWQKEQGAR